MNGNVWTIKVVLEFWFWPLEVPFFCHFWPKVPIFGPKKMAFRVAKSKFYKHFSGNFLQDNGCCWKFGGWEEEMNLVVGNGIYRRARERDIFPSLSLLFLGLTIPFLGVFFHFLGIIFLFLHQIGEGLQDGIILGQFRVGVSFTIPVTLPIWYRSFFWRTWSGLTAHQGWGCLFPELQKRANRADQSVLFFLAGANFWEEHAKNCAIMSMAHITYAIAHWANSTVTVPMVLITHCL